MCVSSPGVRVGGVGGKGGGGREGGREKSRGTGWVDEWVGVVVPRAISTLRRT